MDNNFNEFNNMDTERTNEIQAEAVEVEVASKNVKAKKPRKNHTTLKVLSAVLAVTVVGGGAGFGGAYIANRALTADSALTVNKNVPNSTHLTLDNLQSAANALQHTVSENAELNSDGTYKYTRDLVKAVQDTIVYIDVYTTYLGSKTHVGLASGIIISNDGFIVTNCHVVEDCDEYTVTVSVTDPESGEVTSKTYDSKLIGKDEDTDLAVLKIDATGLQAAKLGDSDKLALGDDVIVIGNPFGLERTVTKGIVSGLHRQISETAHGLTSVQSDAAINGGNSGGAMFNGYGEVIGVVNEKYVANYAESISLAIDINDAKSVIEDLINKGYVSGRPMLGITYKNVSEYYAYRNGIVAGWLVDEINSDYPVAKSGLRVGDTIVKINGESVIGKDGSAVLAKMKPNDTVTVTVARKDSFNRISNVDIEVTLGEATNTN